MIQCRIRELRKSDNGYSPDGDHIYGSSSGLSDSYLGKIVRREREQGIKPLEEKLQVLLNKRSAFDKLSREEPYYREQRTKVGSQIMKEAEDYRCLCTNMGVPSQRIEDYMKKCWGYENGFIRS